MTRTRIAGEDASLSPSLGCETSFSILLPEAVNPTDLVDMEGSSSSTDAGSLARDEETNLRESRCRRSPRCFRTATW